MATSSADSIKASMNMVDKSTVFIGVYAYRYGYAPDGLAVSITELGYDRAPKDEFWVDSDKLDSTNEDDRK